jgi:hypothetical protein
MRRVAYGHPFGRAATVAARELRFAQFVFSVNKQRKERRTCDESHQLD